MNCPNHQAGGDGGGGDDPDDTSCSLERYLASCGQVQTDEAAERNRRAVNRVTEIIKRLNESAQLYVVGSTKMGTWLPGDDIDCVCVVPDSVNRDEFFRDLVDLLPKHLGRNHRVVHLAAVPIVSVRYDGAIVDIQLARIKREKVPADDSDDNNDNINLWDVVQTDPASQKGLNAALNAAYILACVPDRCSFRAATRAIKLWAKQRRVYGAKLGYLSGITCAIMVANVCRRLPSDATAARVVGEFFKRYRSSITDNAVIALNANRLTPPPPASTPSCWQVLTPAIPVQNTVFRVTGSSRRTMEREL